MPPEHMQGGSRCPGPAVEPERARWHDPVLGRQELEAVFCSLSPPGALAPTVALERLTRYSYVKALAFWVDVTAQGKIVSKLFQRSDLLIAATRAVPVRNLPAAAHAALL